MQNNQKNILKERLTNYIEWKNKMDEYFFELEISEKTKKKFYKKKKFLNILLCIYFLPVNIVEYFQRLKENHIYNKGIAAIDVIQEEIKKINKKEENNE